MLQEQATSREHQLKTREEAAKAREGRLVSCEAELPRREEEVLKCVEAVATYDVNAKTRERELVSSASE